MSQKAEMIQDHWNPRIIAELNGQYVKLAKIKGEFVWHKHDNEDELFQVISGTMTMAFRDKTVIVDEGEIIVVPRGVEHKPIATDEVTILLFEPMSTVNTGEQQNELTALDLKRI